MALGAVPASAEVRALVLTADYSGVGDAGLRLANPIADGRRIQKALDKAGVKDLRLVEEPGPQRWQSEFQAFSNRLSSDDIAVVYYAGHAFQIGGENYLVAADGETLIALEEVMKKLTGRAKGTILIIDACRENPLDPGDDPFAVVEVDSPPGASRTMKTVQITEVAARSKGLAQLGDLRGLSAIVLFSTEPGNVAFDGAPGKGSPFATQAAKELARSQSLDSAFRRIAVAVNRATDGKQSPWRQGDLPFDVYLAGMANFPSP